MLPIRHVTNSWRPSNQLARLATFRNRQTGATLPTASSSANSGTHANNQYQQQDSFPLKINDVIRLHQRICKEPSSLQVSGSVFSQGVNVPSIANGSRHSKKAYNHNMDDTDGLDMASMTVEDDFVVIPNFK